MALPDNVIFVHKYVTGGQGTSASPWTGWDTAVSWGAGKVFLFAPGWFQMSATPAGWQNTNDYSLVGSGVGITFLKVTGSGVAVDIRPTLLADAGNHRINIRGFTIDGSGTCTTGLRVGSARRSRFQNINVRNVTTTGLLVDGGISNTFEQITCLKGQDGVDDAATMPTNGIVVDEWVVSGQPEGYGTASAHSFINCWIKGLTKGVWIKRAIGLNFTGGASEVCTQNNLHIQNINYSQDNSFTAFNMEFGNPGNNGEDAILVETSRNLFLCCHCPGSDIRFNGGTHNAVIGGWYREWVDQGDRSILLAGALFDVTNIGSNPLYHNDHLTRIPPNAGS